MIKIKTSFLLLFILPVLILWGPGSVSAENDPPTIETYGRLELVSGDELVIIGENLVPSVNFINQSSGQITSYTGTVTGNGTDLSVRIPNTLAPGKYTVLIDSPFGSAELRRDLTILESRPDFPSGNTPVTAPAATEFEDLIRNIIDYAFVVVGISVFAMIMWGGFLWLTGAANPGNIALAKRKIYNAILGAIILASSYVILNTINPAFVGGGITIPAISSQPSTVLPPGVNCSDPQSIAQFFGTDYPQPQRSSSRWGGAPELDSLIECVLDFPQAANLIDAGQIFTYEQSNQLCNYTRGNEICGACAHTVNSCHYGGSNGRRGSLAVDFNALNPSENGELLLNSHLNNIRAACNFGGIRFEQTSANSWHTHVSTQSCSGN